MEASIFISVGKITTPLVKLDVALYLTDILFYTNQFLARLEEELTSPDYPEPPPVPSRRPACGGFYYSGGCAIKSTNTSVNTIVDPNASSTSISVATPPEQMSAQKSDGTEEEGAEWQNNTALSPGYLKLEHDSDVDEDCDEVEYSCTTDRYGPASNLPTPKTRRLPGIRFCQNITIIYV